jgi:hypothetical protein
MRKEELIKQLQERAPLLANAVSHMVTYVQDRYPSTFPSKEQTEAVNNYLRSVHADGDGSTSERNCEHRRIASQNITIAAIRILTAVNLTGFKMCLTTLHTTRSIICRREDAECTDDFLFWLHHL